MESETLPAFDEAAEAARRDGAAQESAPEGEAAPKKRRGRPKDLNAPKRPPTPKAHVNGPAREKLLAERPELKNDLGQMNAALKEVWEKVPQEEKDRLQKQYEEEMEIWKPKWEEYKKTESYKLFCLEKKEYKDKKEKKKFLKAEAKKAPTRPKSGFGLFSNDIRNRVKEEVMKAGGGMGDIGKQCAAEWQALSETKKAEYQEMAQAQKQKYQAEFAEYRKTQDFKDFQLKKAKMDGRHQLNDLIRKTHKDAPSKPASAFNLFKNKHLKQIMEEHKGASAGELSKKVGEMWKNCSPEEREVHQKEAAVLNAQYKKKLQEFKQQKIYINFLQKRVMVKSRENRQVNLQDMPKKPKNVYALFKDDIKEEVPTGKGEGKGMNFVKNKFQEMADDKKLEYKQKEAELKEKYDEEMKTYKEGETYKTFEKTSGKIKRELLTEAMKVMTLKFLNDAPREPPKNAFSLYLGEKRRADESSGPPKKKSRQETKDEVTQYKTEWSKMDKDAKEVYEAKRKEKVNVWKEEVKAYMELPKWKEYMDEAKLLKVPVKSLLHSKKKAIRKLKNGMKLQPLPERPETMPNKPPKARRIFFLEKRQEVQDPAKIQEMWDGLSEEEKKVYAEKEAERASEYQMALNAFRESDEGKHYVRKVRIVQRSRATAIAKDKFLAEMPKKPLGHLQLYARDKVKELKKAKPDLKGADLKAEITNTWKALSDDEKKTWEDKGTKLWDEYKAKLTEFQGTENFKKYTSAIKRLAKPKAKAKAGPGVPQKPSNMPAKPPDALKLFKQQAGAGKKGAELMEAFKELPTEEKEKLKAEAEEALKHFEDEMKEWKKTDDAKKYFKATKALEKKRKLANARQKYLKEEPKRPPSAVSFFCNEKRSEYQPQFPDLKGLRLNGKMAEIYRGLPEEERKVYEDMARQSKEDYEKKLEEFQQGSDYKKYLAIAKPKPKGKARAAKQEKKGPAQPDAMPKRPPSAMTLFARANPGLGGLAGQAKAWKELDSEAQKKYQQEAKEKAEEYEQEMAGFKKTAEGKRYYRLKAAAEKKTRIEAARKKYMEGAPPKPKPAPSAYQFFVQEKKPALLEAGVAISEIAKDLSGQWGGLSEEGKKPYVDKEAQAKEKYDEEYEEYKSFEGFKKFERYKAQQNKKPTKKSKSQAKPKGKAKAKARPKAKAGGRKAAEKAQESDSDSDVMGSDSESSSSSSSD